MKKELIETFFQNKEALTTHISAFLEQLKSEEPLREKFILYAVEQVNQQALLNIPSKELVLSILQELNFPNHLYHYFDLYYAILEKVGYDLDNDGGDGWHVLTDDENNFQTIGMFQADLFVFDYNLDNPEVTLCSHDSVPSSEDAIPILYEDNYGFWFNEETEMLHNPNNLLLDKIFDEEGEYIYDSPYILAFLTGEDSGLKKLGFSYHTFVNFVLLETKDQYTKLFL